VIVGAGFGGLSVARGLRRAGIDVVLVDQNNYHLFTPLLYEVGTALLDSSEIAYPVRGIFHRVPNVDFRKGRVTHIDLSAREVRTAEGAIGYDNGHVRLLSRDILERLCCECYAVVRRECDRLLPRSVVQ